MKMMKYFMLLLFVGATLTFTSCSDDDDDTEENTPGITDNEDPDLKAEALEGEIKGDITLSADEEWTLTGALVVKEGYSLTIEPGTTIKAEAGGTDVYIAVERGAQIFVNGTSTDPVIMTSAAATPAPGNWGGLLVMGYAPITGGQTAVTEVVDFFYGGNDAADDSGDITYLIIEYTGAVINEEKEFNGLTLYGVGNGTKVENIFIRNGNDDSIEFFGGTVNVTNVMAVNARDDMFDWTQGYKGTITNAYGIREAGFDVVSSDPRGIEGDGNFDGLTPNATPQSGPTVTNITIVNNSTVAGVMNDVVKIRRGSSATITNALYVSGTNVPAPGDFVDLADGAGVAAASTTVNISVTGNGASSIATDITKTATVNGQSVTSEGTVTVPANANAGTATTNFTWTGYTFP